MLTFNIITLFPEFFDSPLKAGLLGRAIKNNLLSFSFYNPRDFSLDKHRHVDDRPFGGGPGMVMQLEPLLGALQAIECKGRVLLMSPQGRQLDHTLAKSLALEKHLTIICGRYEGIDARIKEFLPIEEISLCPAILNGGETAALALIEATGRFVPGFLGKEESAQDESFSGGLLEYPQYTRPENYAGRQVPEILLNGNHKLIEDWRRTQALILTLQKNPEMLEAASLDQRDVNILKNTARYRVGKNLSFCLCHYPVKIENDKTGISSLTNLDIHDIARISCGFGMGPFFVLTPLQDQLDLLHNILRHWLIEVQNKEHVDRQKALKLVQPVADFSELAKKAAIFYGTEPEYIVTSATWPVKNSEMLTFKDVFHLCENRPVVILLGTARGLDIDSLKINYSRLRPLRFLDENHFSVRSAAAILADRILGDFY